MKTLPTTSVKKTSILATFLTTFLIALPSCSVKKEVTATGESAGGTTLPQSNPAGSGAGCDFSKHSRSFGESAGKEIKEPTSVAMEKLEIVSLHYSRLSENNGAQKSSSLFEFSGDDAENLKSDCYGSSDGSIVISAGQQDTVAIAFMKEGESTYSAPLFLKLELSSDGESAKLKGSVEENNFITTNSALELLKQSGNWSAVKFFRLENGTVEIHLSRSNDFGPFRDSVVVIGTFKLNG
jgi:hypothetical protein